MVIHRLVALGAFLVCSAAHAQTVTCDRLALALAIDRSGSMTGAKMNAAKTGAQAVIDKLTPHDCVTIIAFDAAPTTVVALHEVTDPATIKTAVASIQPAGGTEILAALTAAHQALRPAHARKRHVILLTDGQSPVAGLQALAQTMATEHVTLTTVGVGPDIDEPTLRALSTTGGGRYFGVADVTQVARVLPREVDVVLGP